MTKKQLSRAALPLKDYEQEDFAGLPLVKGISGAKKVVCFDPEAEFNTSLIRIGLQQLDRWEVLVPFRRYNELAVDFFGEKDPAMKQALGDLRIPVYDPRLVMLRVNNTTRALWKRYNELSAEYDWRIAFQLALWETKPHYYPLPAGVWI